MQAAGLRGAGTRTVAFVRCLFGAWNAHSAIRSGACCNMPLSMSIVSFLSYYDGLGKLQQPYLTWLQDRKEDIRRQLLLGQLRANLMELEEEAQLHAGGAKTAVDDAEDAKFRLRSLEKEERGAVSAAEAARLARNEEELETAQAIVRMAERKREEAEEEAEAALLYIQEVENLRDDALAAVESATEELVRVERRLEDGVPAFEVVEKLGLALAPRLALFKAWEDAEAEHLVQGVDQERLTKLDKTAAAGVAAAMALDGQGHADGSGQGLTALDLVRLVRALKEADAREVKRIGA